MTEIAPDVVEALHAASEDEPVRLLVTCQGPADKVVNQLETGEVTVVNTMPELTVVVVEAREKDLTVLQGLENVTAIERDSEQRALED